jgi:hypothetical protein
MGKNSRTEKEIAAFRLPIPLFVIACAIHSLTLSECDGDVSPTDEMPRVSRG